jgi:hypothetical protein
MNKWPPVTDFDCEYIEIERIMPHLKIDEFIKEPISQKNLHELVSKYLANVKNNAKSCLGELDKCAFRYVYLGRQQ